MLDVKNILITGESGFIGSHLINHFSDKYKNYSLHGLDMLTYAANRTYTKKLDLNPNYKFHQIDICNRKAIFSLFNQYQFTDVIHLAAESHVDNSIDNPLLFVKTNIIGTVNLLDAFKQYSTGKFHHVSTDEVYGDLDFKDSPFCEKNPYKPSSPYSASKASSDHFVQAYHRTYGVNTIITNCSNNYGPHQHAEKFIPTIIYSIANNTKIPIYGSGENSRDWLYVKDHVDAIDKVFHYGKIGETYNIGANNELSNIDLVHKICDIFQFKGLHLKPKELITFVDDRLGHDNRYAIDYSKLKNELNWEPQFAFEESLSKTIDWYIKQ
tara:strand:- start:1891 stop:2865 length:975 start_codon:yes stop_codon:yes gene_type:complete